MSGALNKLRKSISLRLSPSRPSGSSNSSIASEVSAAGIRSGRRSERSSSSKGTCAICLVSMQAGQGQALFTAECSHTFHFHCISSSVKHGNRLCPVCRAKWKHVPFPAPEGINARTTQVAPLGNMVFSQQVPPPPAEPEPELFADDEPLPRLNTNQNSSTDRMIEILTFTELPAVPASESRSEFAVLLSLRAPPVTGDTRAPIDLVAVLDISGSMNGLKVVLLKRAVTFLINQLGPEDRLAMVSFSSSAQRVLPLHRMTQEGRERAILAANSLSCCGGTNIVLGLRKGVRILEERQVRNPVSSIILLSDGQDSCNQDCRSIPGALAGNGPSWFVSLLPASVRSKRNGAAALLGPAMRIPVHTFGFGMDHDAVIMHAMSDASGGTFSFIQEEEMIQDAFAQCIGGLLTVVAQEVQLTFTSAVAEVVLQPVPAGSCYSTKLENETRRGVIDVGDIYADEAKDFLVHVSIPAVAVADDPSQLLDVDCIYKDPLSRAPVQVSRKSVYIRRPETVTPDEREVNVEVDRQRNRIYVAHGIAEAQELAEKGDLEGAKALLAKRKKGLTSSKSAQTGDELCRALEDELKEIEARMTTRESYEIAGRAYMLSGRSSLLSQRAATRRIGRVGNLGGRASLSGPVVFETPSMTDMVTRSQALSLSGAMATSLTVHFPVPPPVQPPEWARRSFRRRD